MLSWASSRPRTCRCAASWHRDGAGWCRSISRASTARTTACAQVGVGLRRRRRHRQLRAGQARPRPGGGGAAWAGGGHGRSAGGAAPGPRLARPGAGGCRAGDPGVRRPQALRRDPALSRADPGRRGRRNGPGAQDRPALPAGRLAQRGHRQARARAGARLREMQLAVSADGRYVPLRLEGSLDGLPITAVLAGDCAGPSGCAASRGLRPKPSAPRPSRSGTGRARRSRASRG